MVTTPAVKPVKLAPLSPHQLVSTDICTPATVHREKNSSALWCLSRMLYLNIWEGKSSQQGLFASGGKLPVYFIVLSPPVTFGRSTIKPLQPGLSSELCC